MEMLGKILAPCVEDGRDPDRPAEVSGITTKTEQGVGRCPEEERVDDARIALRERVEGMREGEDDVKVRNGQQVGAAGGEPPFLREPLALRTMTIATRVIGEPRGPAAVTRLPMPAQESGAAGRNRPEHHVLDLREAVRPTIPVAVCPHNIREFKPRRDARGRRAHRHGAHGSALRRRGKPLQQIERRVRPHLRVARQLNIAGRRADVPVPE